MITYNPIFYDVNLLSDPTGALLHLTDQQCLVILKNRLNHAHSRGKRFKLIQDIKVLENRISQAALNQIAPAPAPMAPPAPVPKVVPAPLPKFAAAPLHPPGPLGVSVPDLFIPKSTDNFGMKLIKIAIDTAFIAAGLKFGIDFAARLQIPAALAATGGAAGTVAGAAAAINNAATAVANIAAPVIDRAAAAKELGKKIWIIFRYCAKGHDIEWILRHGKISENLYNFLRLR